MSQAQNCLNAKTALAGARFPVPFPTALRRLPAGALGFACTVASGSSGNGFRSKIPVSVYQFLLTLVVHQQHDFLMLAARLQTYAPASNGDERGCAPTTRRPAAHHAIAVLTTHDESGFGQFRDNGNALCVS